MEEENSNTINNTKKIKKKNKAPNHILNDGTFIYLPEATNKDRSNFFERSIAEYGLVSAVAESESDKTSDDNDNIVNDNETNKGKEVEETLLKVEMNDTTTTISGTDDESSKEALRNKQKQQQEQKIHPLAIASARLQGYGISELSKAINLGGLVVSSDYLDLANIVSQSSSQSQQQSQQKQQSSDVVKSDDKSSDASTATNAASSTVVSSEDSLLKSDTDKIDEHTYIEEQRLRSSYILKRKHKQFEHVTNVLSLHTKRLKRSLTIQSILDKRYLQLRKKWRLVAPEHGTKVIGPVRSTEIVAIDVEIYNRDRTITTTNFSSSALARLIPRYVTIQLKNDNNNKKKTSVIVAEPFLIADPTIGRIIDDPEYFDPNNVPKLTLLLSIEKSSSGYIQYAKAQPSSSSMSTSSDNDNNENNNNDDEKVTIDLQHSLFCASLFDSMKQEVTTINNNTTTATTTTTSNTAPAAAWISSEMEDAYLPPKNLMTNSNTTTNDGICVIHVHQGEIKVQLNYEYSITFKLIENNASTTTTTNDDKNCNNNNNSGSQTSKELKVLCRTLLLNAQFIYHDYCMNEKTTDNKISTKDNKSNAFKTRTKTNITTPHIVNQCVHLGAKILLEKKARIMLQNLQLWYNTTYEYNYTTKKNEYYPIIIQFLDLTLFDVYSQFVISIDNLFSCDVTMHSSDGITVAMNNCLIGENYDSSSNAVDTIDDSGGGGDGIYRNVTFGSIHELELFLKFQIQKAYTLDAI